MRNRLLVLSLLLCSAYPAAAQVSIGVGLPHVSIGINLTVYPLLEPVPGYPVYYAPRLDSNYFFYDGMYWVYQGDGWYMSSWYNGPWDFVTPEFVPEYVLRVPVRYYRQPPAYFYGWISSAPPRWDEHWGNDWARRRSGWDREGRGPAPARAPLPLYQQKYSGDRYPRGEQQQRLHNENYGYQTRDPVLRQLRQAPPVQGAPAPAPERRGQGPAAEKGQGLAPQREQRSAPQREQRAAPQPEQGAAPQREQGAAPERGRGPGQEADPGQAAERGQERGQERERDKAPDRGRERRN